MSPMKFYDIEAEFYDIFYFDFKDDIPLYQKYAEGCRKILELMCGTGRIIYYLNTRAEIWGIDSNERMLEKAKKNLQGKNVKLLKRDARNFNLGEKFCLIIIGLNSLTMFHKKERIAILKNVREHLDKNGKIVVDVFNPFTMVEGIVHHGDTKFVENRIYSRFFVPLWEENHWKLLYFYDVVDGDALRRKVATLHLYPLGLEELRSEFAEAGLKILEVYGDYKFGEFDEERSERLIVVGARNDSDQKG